MSVGAASQERNAPSPPMKDMSGEMAPAYLPIDVEKDWQEWWQQMGFFKPEIHPEGEPYVMCLPPPNVTGSLHLGHALMAAIEDCMARYHRMCGKAVLWVPGTDHAGIATQVVVEKMLMRQKNLSRHDLGREAFVEEVYKWKEEYGSHICNQLRRMGVSLDWDRQFFTMDERLSRSVQEAFLRMYSSGKIYRANRLVNWSSHLRTAISDIEVDYITLEKPQNLRVPGHTRTIEFGVFHSFSYQLEGTSSANDRLTVATTRIETMLGDVAVAVHPLDERYKRFHGRFLTHPFFTDRRIAVICDDILVDMEKGTGAVKVTPAHDPNDFACGQRHNLRQISIFDEEGKINAAGGPEFCGMMRFDARRIIIQKLDAIGLYEGKKDNPGMRLGLCSRSGDVIEPMTKPQWWVDCGEMAKRAADAVREKKLEILPVTQEKTWFQWLDNIRDWCISRQLWWGHRIPAYMVLIDGVKQPQSECNMKYWVVAGSQADAMRIVTDRFPEIDVSRVQLEQDEDVLDTWFSSGLLPFSIFDWPHVDQPSSDFVKFYPNTILETGGDILFFWVARMTMLGLELTDQLPFKTIFLHPMVRDKLGRKMSKSLGNVIDPLDVVTGITLDELNDKLRLSNLPENEIKKAIGEQDKAYKKSNGIPECGTDGLRFGLLSYTAQGRNINLDVYRVLGYRQFCNKLWNAVRFCLPQFDQTFIAKKDFNEMTDVDGALQDALPYDRWIISRLQHTIQKCNNGFAEFDFASATMAMYEFTLNEFCGVYLEVTKPVFLAGTEPQKAVARDVLHTCLDVILRLMHPVMPFVTEELWQRLPARKSDAVNGSQSSIMIQPYPKANELLFDEEVQSTIDLASQIVHSVLSTKAGLGLKPSARPDLIVRYQSSAGREQLTQAHLMIRTLAKVDTFGVIGPDDAAPQGYAPSVVDDQATIYLNVAGLIDFAHECGRLVKKQTTLQTTMDRLAARVKTDIYQTKTPEHVRENDRQTMDKLDGEIQSIQDAIDALNRIRSSIDQRT